MDKQISVPEHIKQLISGQLSGSLSAEELNLLESWINESPDHKMYFNEMRYVWVLADKKITGRNHVESVWKLSNKIKRNVKHERTFWTWQKIAALEKFDDTAMFMPLTAEGNGSPFSSKGFHQQFFVI